MPTELPRLDSDPDEWGPDHIDLVEDQLTADELAELIEEGNLQGRLIDAHNGLDL